MSSRRLLNLIQRLPADSEYHRELRGETRNEQWTTTELLSIIVDRLSVLDWHFVCAHSESPPDPPSPLPRPGRALAPVEPQEIVPADPKDIAGFFA